MNTTIENSKKKVWETPQIEMIKMDYEISLSLESPPVDPFSSNQNDNSMNDPYKTNVG